MKQLNLLIVLSLLFYNITAAAAGEEARITLHVVSPEFRNQQMVLTLQDEYLYGSLNSYQLTAKADGNGNYTFVVRNIKAYKKISMNIGDHHILEGYLEAGDQIKVNYSGTANKLVKLNNYNFSGSGSAKLAMATELNFYQQGLRLKLSQKPQFDQAKIDALLQNADAEYREKISIVNSFAQRISGTMKDMYRAEVFGSVYSSILYSMELTKKAVIEEKDAAYLVHQIEKRDENRHTDISADSPAYIDYVWWKSVFNVIHKAVTERRHYYAGIFRDLISNNSGMIAEKAVIYFICKDPRAKYSDDANGVNEQAMEKMSNKKHEIFLRSLIESRKTGVKAFDFSLTDMEGKNVRLHDFKGKVVVLDLWYNGCGGCAGLAKVMKASVLPQFTDEKDVVFVTVNVDRTRELWLQGVSSGLYTDKRSINLYTDGEMINHPFIKYYKFLAFPQLLIIGRDSHLISMELTHNAEVISEKIKNGLNKS